MNKLHMVANSWITDANPTNYRWQQTHRFSKKKKKNKQTNKQTKTQYSRSIHQVKQKPHQKPNLKKKTSLAINDNKQTARAPSTSVISDRATNTSSKAHWALEIGDQSDRIGDRSCLDVLPNDAALQFSLRPPCSLNLKVFLLFLSLVSYIYGLMG